MRNFEKGIVYLSALGVSGYAVFVYVFLPLGALVHPDMKVNFQAHSAGIYTHIFASLFALLIGPFQFSQRIRQQHRKIHRWLGRVYLAVGVLIGGLSGLYMSQFAYGGLLAKSGFAMLAVLWLYTGFRAYTAIREGDFTEHKKWMIRNFSLTFAAVMLRIYLPVSILAGINFTTAYAIIAWLCWVPNMIFVELRYNRLTQTFKDQVSQ